MGSRFPKYALAVGLLMAPAVSFAGAGDPGTGVGGSDSPSSQPQARKQAGPYGHCSHDANGRAYCRSPIRK